jgi:hypothetical protein
MNEIISYDFDMDDEEVGKGDGGQHKPQSL